MIFAEIAENLKGPLSRTATVDDLELFNDSSYHDALNGILKEPKKRHGRDDLQIHLDVGKGKACELGVQKLIPGAYVYSEEWNINDRHSYGKDVVTDDGIRIEVKSTKYSHRFSLEHSSWLKLLRNIKEKTLDVIVTAHPVYDVTSHRWQITPGFIIDPFTYELLCDKSYSDMIKKTMCLYRDDLAVKRNYVVYVNTTSSD